MLKMIRNQKKRQVHVFVNYIVRHFNISTDEATSIIRGTCTRQETGHIKISNTISRHGSFRNKKQKLFSLRKSLPTNVSRGSAQVCQGQAGHQKSRVAM